MDGKRWEPRVSFFDDDLSVAKSCASPTMSIVVWTVSNGMGCMDKRARGPPTTLLLVKRS